MKRPQSTRWRKAMQHIVVPIAVLSTCTYILYGSYRIYQTRQQNKLTANITITAATTGLSDGQMPSTPTGHGITTHPQTASNATGTAKDNNSTGASAGRNATGNTSTAAGTNNNTTGSNNSASSNSNAGHSKPPDPVAIDVGFAPVSGGQVSPARAPSGTTSTPEAVVLQYGSNPQTNFIDAALATPSGAHLAVPADVNSQRLLALPLTKGILWAVLPPTGSVGSDGKMGTSSTATAIHYTLYENSSGVATTNLNTEMTTLGTIPITTSDTGAAPGTNWYEPTHITNNNLSGSDTQNSTNAANSTSQGTNNATGATNQSSTDNTSGSAAGSSTATVADGGANLYLRGFYQTAVGAVLMVIKQQPDGAQSNLVYLWNESTMTLQLMCVLQNSGTQFSWIAVGPRLVYWETRQVTSAMAHGYQGADYVLNVQTGIKTHIALGQWSSQATVDGDNLLFQVKNTAMWEQFTPNQTIVGSSAN